MWGKKEKFEAFDSPYIGLEEHNGYHVLFHKEGHYSICLEVNNPIINGSADGGLFEDAHSVLESALNVLGDEVFISKKDVLSYQPYRRETKEDFLADSFERHFEGRLIRTIRTYLTITKKVKRSKFFQYSKRDFEAFLNRMNKAVTLLGDAKMHPRVMNEEEIKALIIDSLSCDFSKSSLVDNIKVTDDCLQLGNEEVKTLSMVDVDYMNIPEQIGPFHVNTELGYEVPSDLFSFLFKLEHYKSMVFNQILYIPNQGSENNNLRTKRDRHSSIPDPANDVAMADIDIVLSDIAQNSRMLVRCHFSFTYRAEKENAHRITNAIENHLMAQGIVMSKNAFNQMELLRAMMPGNATELKEYDMFLTSAQAALCYFLKERLVGSTKSSFKLRFASRDGAPVAIDLNDEPMENGEINNRNKFVLGPSGTGKSFFMNHMIRQYCEHNVDIVMVDTGHSYSGLCSYYNGTYITYSDENPITFNPFLFDQREYNEEKKEFLKTLISLCWKGVNQALDQVEDTVIAMTIDAYYAKAFNVETDVELSFNSFFEFSLSEIETIAASNEVPFNLNEYRFVLKKFYRGGIFEEILNKQADQSLFDEKFIVFEIDAIKEHKVLFPITTIIIMDVFIQKMRRKKNRKALVIEEAWKAIASPMMAGYILYLYKTVRKFWGEAVVVTQELDDIIGNAIVKDSIINNSDTIVLLDQAKLKDNYDSVSQLLSLNDIDKRKIFTINRLANKDNRGKFKEVFIKSGSRGNVFGIEVSIQEYLCFTTESKEKLVVNDYAAEYGFENGINMLLKDIKEKDLSIADFCSEYVENQQKQLV